jgi:CubicO group peptidase (beta-lactamase class C family)
VEVAAAGVLSFPAGSDRPASGSARRLIGPADRSFPWASVTKPASALAVLVAVEEGTISLETEAGPPGATVAHLLSHASGLAPDGGRWLAPPGIRRIYSNAGYAVLEAVVTERSGLPFERYLAEAVLEPLGMDSTRLVVDPGQGGWTGAAAGLHGPLVDLLALVAEWAVPTLVSPDTHRRATTTAFPGLSGVLPGFGRFDPCDWGLGVELRGRKQPHWTGTANSTATFGHFGRSGSYFWVDPAAGTACAGLTDRPFGPWAADAWPRLADAVLAETGTSGDRS